MVKTDANIKTVKENLSKTEETSELQHLREMEKKYDSLFETIVLGVVYQDINGQIISANHAAEKILGLSIDQMKGRTSTDSRWKSIHKDGSDFPGETHPAIIALKTGKKIENVIMGVYDPKKEETRWININATPLYNKDETKPFQVYTTFEEITERKKAEAALKSNQELFKKTFDGVSFPISIVRASDNQIVDINEAYLRMVEYHKEEVVGHTAKELQIFPKYEEREKIARLVHDGSQVRNQEIDVRTKSGKILRALFSVDLINFDNQPHFLGSIINITDRKKAEEALKESERNIVICLS